MNSNHSHRFRPASYIKRQQINSTQSTIHDQISKGKKDIDQTTLSVRQHIKKIRSNENIFTDCQMKNQLNNKLLNHHALQNLPKKQQVILDNDGHQFRNSIEQLICKQKQTQDIQAVEIKDYIIKLMGMLKKINPYDTLARIELPPKYQLESPDKVNNLREYRSKSVHEPVVIKNDQFVFRRGQAIYVAKNKKQTSCSKLLQKPIESNFLIDNQKSSQNQPLKIQYPKSQNSLEQHHKLIEQDFSRYLKRHVNNSLIQTIQKQQKESLFISDIEFFNIQQNKENMSPTKSQMNQPTAIKEQKLIGQSDSKKSSKIQQLNTRELRQYLDRKNSCRNKVRVSFNHFPQDFFK